MIGHFVECQTYPADSHFQADLTKVMLFSLSPLKSFAFISQNSA